MAKKNGSEIVPAMTDAERARYAEIGTLVRRHTEEMFILIAEVRDQKLYREDDSCKRTWVGFCDLLGLSEPTVNRLIAHSKFNQFLVEQGQEPIESKMLTFELTKFDTNKVADAVKQLRERNEDITLDAVTEIINPGSKPKGKGKEKSTSKDNGNRRTVYGYIISGDEVLKKEMGTIKKADGVIYGSEKEAQNAIRFAKSKSNNHQTSGGWTSPSVSGQEVKEGEVEEVKDDQGNGQGDKDANLPEWTNANSTEDLSDDGKEELQREIWARFTEMRDDFSPHEAYVEATILDLLTDKKSRQAAAAVTLESKTREILEVPYQQGHTINFAMEELIEGLRRENLNITGRKPVKVRNILKGSASLDEAIAAFKKANPTPQFTGAWD